MCHVKFHFYLMYKNIQPWNNWVTRYIVFPKIITSNMCVLCDFSQSVDLQYRIYILYSCMLAYIKSYSTFHFCTYMIRKIFNSKHQVGISSIFKKVKTNSTEKCSFLWGHWKSNKKVFLESHNSLYECDLFAPLFNA